MIAGMTETMYVVALLRVRKGIAMPVDGRGARRHSGENTVSAIDVAYQPTKAYRRSRSPLSP
jgi:hypothetical protein